MGGGVLEGFQPGFYMPQASVFPSVQWEELEEEVPSFSALVPRRSLQPTALTVLFPGRGGLPSPRRQWRSCGTSSAWTSRSASRTSWPSLTTTCPPSRESAPQPRPAPPHPGCACHLLPAPLTAGWEKVLRSPSIAAYPCVYLCDSLQALIFPFWKVGIMSRKFFNFYRKVTV